MSRVLAVVAHPDDELLGVGGTLLRHVAAGDSVGVYIVYGGPGYVDGQAEPARRIAEAAGWLVTIDDRERVAGVPCRSAVESVIATVKPEIVYTHFWDLNDDHRLVADAVLVATRPYASRVRAVRQFHTPSSTEWAGVAFKPTYYVDITTTATRKLELFTEYQSEVRSAPHPRALVSLWDRASTWGSEAGLHYAEAFVTVRERW